MRMPQQALPFLLTALLIACAPAPASPATAAATATQAATATTAPSLEPLPAPSHTPAPTAPATPSLDWVLKAPAGRVPYRLPLVLRHVSSTSAVLQFRLAEAVPAELVLWRASDRGELRQFSFAEGGGQLIVGDLEPGTPYEAAVLVPGEVPSRPTAGGERWPLIRFTTRGGFHEPLRVVAFGDSGFGEEVTRTMTESMAREGVDLALHTGDIVYRVQEDADPPSAFLGKLYGPLAPLLQVAPLYPVAGNHEFDRPTYWRGAPYFFEAFPPVFHSEFDLAPESDGSWYAFSQADIQFLMLNSQSVFGWPGYEDQTDWLAARIADDSFRYNVAVVHVPPLSVGRHAGDARILRSRWGELLASPRVPLVLSGHDHNYQRFETVDTTYIISGGGSASLYEFAGVDQNLRAWRSVSHYVRLVLGDRTIELQAVDREGSVFDQATIDVALP